MPDNTLKLNAAAEIAAENRTELAKVAWLSTKQNGKAYGSLVAYFNKGPEAARFLQEEYMYVGRELANIRIFETQIGPLRCYNCQGLGHKAFNCQSDKRCGNYAQSGHSWKEYSASIPKYPLCSGPHNVTSRYYLAPHGR